MSGQVIAEFLRELFTTGELLIPLLNEEQILSALQPHAPPSRAVRSFEPMGKPVETIEGALFNAERIWRNELPESLPAFDIDIAKKAAVVVFSICRSISDARFNAGQVESVLNRVDLRKPQSASDHYSADLVLHFLPQLAERSGRISDETLSTVVAGICRDWPLSSVGVSGITITPLAAELRTGGLYQVLIDRIIATRDTRWLVDSGVRSSVESAIGPFEELDPELSRLLKQHDTLRPDSADSSS